MLLAKRRNQRSRTRREDLDRRRTPASCAACPSATAGTRSRGDRARLRTRLPRRCRRGLRDRRTGTRGRASPAPRGCSARRHLQGGAAALEFDLEAAGWRLPRVVACRRREPFEVQRVGTEAPLANRFHQRCRAAAVHPRAGPTSDISAATSSGAPCSSSQWKRTRLPSACSSKPMRTWCAPRTPGRPSQLLHQRISGQGGDADAAGHEQAAAHRPARSCWPARCRRSLPPRSMGMQVLRAAAAVGRAAHAEHVAVALALVAGQRILAPAGRWAGAA